MISVIDINLKRQINSHFLIKEHLLYSHLLRRCSNVEELGDIVEQVVLLPHSTDQNHCVLSHLVNVDKDIQKRRQKNYQ